MLDKIEDKELDTLNSKGLDDLSVLKQIFDINQLMQQSKSERIRNYFTNYYNDLRVVVLKRDFIDLYPKLDQIESNWASSHVPSKIFKLNLTDSQIDNGLSGRQHKTVDDFYQAIRSLGEQSSNESLRNIDKRQVSQNEFVNQKTVYNSLVHEVMLENKNLYTVDILKNYSIGSNDIFRTNEEKPVKKWKPTIN